LLVIGVVAFLDRSQVPLGAAIVAGFFLVTTYESAIERLALTAAARLAAVNLLQFVQIIVYAISVVLVLRAGGGLFGVFACQLGSVLVARILLPFCWQGTRPIAKHMIGTLRPLLARRGLALSLNRGAGLACGCRSSVSEASFDFAKRSQNYWLESQQL
jgi:hypothetical protein